MFHFRNNESYTWILLLLAGDQTCGYYRAPIFFILNRKKLIPIKDNDGNDILEDPTFEEGINDIKDIFGSHYDIQLLDLEKLMKIKKIDFWMLIKNGVKIVTGRIKKSIIIIFLL